jgi:hypothetical protein
MCSSAAATALEGGFGKGATRRGRAESSAVLTACTTVGGNGNGLSSMWVVGACCSRATMLVSVSFVASAQDKGEGGVEGRADTEENRSPSPGRSLMGEISTPKAGERVGREKFSTDLDNRTLLGVVTGAKASSFGGGAGRGGVVGRSGMIEEVGEGIAASSGCCPKGKDDDGRSSTTMPRISLAGRCPARNAVNSVANSVTVARFKL